MNIAVLDILLTENKGKQLLKYFKYIVSHAQAVVLPSSEYEGANVLYTNAKRAVQHFKLTCRKR